MSESGQRGGAHVRRDPSAEQQWHDAPAQGARAAAPVDPAPRADRQYASQAPQSGKPKKPKKQKKPWDLKSRILLIIGIVLLVAAGSLGAYIAHGYLDARAKYGSINEASGLDSSVFDEILQGTKTLFDIDIDWDALRKINPDIVGWVYVEGTDINYPIVQGDDNDYYLHHNFDNSPSSSGAIFLDMDNNPDFESDNNIIYGHNMLDGSMFAQITKFKEQDFLEKNYHIIIATPRRAYLLSPAFTYICDGADELRQVDFASRTDMQDYISELMGKAVTESLVDVTKIDKLFSLVTCSYEANDVRTVLCCVQRDAVSF